MKGFEFTNLVGENCWKSKLLVTVSVAGLLVFAPYKIFPLGIDISAKAQNIAEANLFDEVKSSEDAQLLLESDDLNYDNERELVIATGNVQITYGKHSLVADRVEYNQQSGRMTAIGNVEILEPNGNRIYATEIDVTDDFKDGFVSALNVETADNTRIAAESAGRTDGRTTHFKNGVYTACKPCQDDPSRPAFWQIRSKKITINEETKSIEYEKPRFEFFGVPVLGLPKFSHPDPSVKRRTGFLLPTMGEEDALGAYYGLSYFVNLAPNYDLTLYGTYYTKQGFLGEVEWRHRLENGEYSIRYAGIDQDNPEAFGNSNFVDTQETDRHAVTTSGHFDINRKWAFGWDALYQSDNNFARTYEIEGAKSRDIVNEIYLTGLGDKNYFDLRAQDFLVQDNQIDFNEDLPGDQSYNGQQAMLLPSFDYNTVSGEEFAYGQLAMNLNFASVDRNTYQIDNFNDADEDNNNNTIEPHITSDERFTGLEGRSNRFSAEIEWKNSKILPGGALVTTELSYRGGAIDNDTDNLGTVYNPLTTNETLFRSMPAASFEIRYPLIAQSESTTQIFEPIAQIVVRPDEENIGEFANEDAQSFVFDTTNLFERDKFSGYDRVEGGTRANVGFRYSANFDNGGSFDLVAGQSFHLDGQNSYAESYKDLTNAGEESGLESTRSDYVASAQLDNGQGFSTGAQVRLDKSNLDLRRASVSTSIVQPNYSLYGNYTFIDSQPNYRSDQVRHEINGAASLRLDENWRLYGGLTYDIEAEDIIRENIGLAYNNDCFSFSVGYAGSNGELFGSSTDHSVSVSLGLRTIGSAQTAFNVNQASDQ